MSYYAKISFKSIKSDQIYSFLQSLKTVMTKNFDKIAEENYIYCPFYNNCKDVSFKQLRNNILLWSNAETWMIKLFTYRWFYISEWNLLGVYSIPESVESFFDGTVHFQDSCDQDYEKSEYSNIKVFEDIYDKWMSFTKNEIYNLIKNDIDIDINDFNSTIDYYKRWFAYREIWSHLVDTLENDDSTIYLSLYSSRFDYFNCINFLRLCYNNITNSNI